MTEREEQAMIQKARAGDPQANYEMCLWALEQAQAEPGEERWKRLAAKCLVDSAKAGYGPAQKKMEELIAGRRPETPPDDQVVMPGWDEPEPEPVPAPEPAGDDDLWNRPLEVGEYDAPEEYDAEDDPVARARKEVENLRAAFGHGAQEQPKPQPREEPPQKSGRLGLGRLAAGLGKKPAEKTPQKPAEKAARQPQRAQKPESGFGGKAKALLQKPAGWSEATWKKIELVCLIVAAVMVVLIVILLVTGKGGKADPAPTPSPTPEIVATPEPTVEPFPTAMILSEITNAATLDYKPLEEQFLSAAENRTVSADSLNLRRGPGTSYGTIGDSMANGLVVQIYATKTNDDGGAWALLNAGGKWGWASMDYLKP